MATDTFYNEFKEVYQAVNIIGKEIMAMKKKLEAIDANVNDIKKKIESQKAIETQKAESQQQKSPADDPEKKVAYDRYVRARTGDFKPGDKEIDVNNVFYSGSRKRV